MWAYARSISFLSILLYGHTEAAEAAAVASMAVAEGEGERWFMKLRK